MTQKATGGPAFPTKNATTGDVLGLSIRDYFAARAPEVPRDFGWAQGERDSWQRRARWAYAYADAMLAARGAQ